LTIGNHMRGSLVEADPEWDHKKDFEVTKKRITTMSYDR
jgi:hypothetical protein